MADGEPYVFSPGDPPSTGSTTHLYIPLLAGLYKLGATGEAFLYASFIMNALFYLGIIVLIWLIAKRMNPKALPLVMILTVLGGHTVSAALKQTDIGFFMLLAMGLLASLVYGRYGWSFVLALLCAAARPEGLVFAIAFLICGTTGLMLNRRILNAPGSKKQCQWFLACGAVAAAVFMLTLFINHILTGHFQFMSVAHKGYFKLYPFAGALEHSLRDAVDLIKGVFFGLQPSFRQYYFFPLLAGLLGLIGILLYERKSKEIRLCECWLVMSAGAALMLVASSQWQGLSNDRYLGWMIPIWIIYISIGLIEIAHRVRARYFLPICGTLLGLYQCISLAYVGARSYSHAVEMENQRALANRISESFDPSVRFGSTVGSGIHFNLPRHKVYNLSGISTPAFFVPYDGMHYHRLIDQLKHQPQLRFDYWICTEEFIDSTPWIAPLVGELVMQDTDTAIIGNKAFGIYKTIWDTLDGGAEPRLLGDRLKDLTLIDRLDIGHIQHEADHDYAYDIRIKNAAIPTMAATDKLGSRDYSEAGRIILGSESFNVHGAWENKPLVLVLRTGRQTQGSIYFDQQYTSINKLELNDELVLRVFVDEIEVPCPPLDISGDGFKEVAIEIPAQYIQRIHPRITVVGDHVSFAYWFYQ
jgi:hypothetical protein